MGSDIGHAVGVPNAVNAALSSPMKENSKKSKDLVILFCFFWSFFINFCFTIFVLLILVHQIDVINVKSIFLNGFNFGLL